MGVDVRLLKRRGEQEVHGESLYKPSVHRGSTTNEFYYSHCYPLYYHSRGVSQRKKFASQYYLRAGGL